MTRSGIAALAMAGALGACGGGGPKGATTPTGTGPGTGVGRVDADLEADLDAKADDPRAVQLAKMNALLGELADAVRTITDEQPASAARCQQLASAVTTWGEANYQDYETADGEGTYLGLTPADAKDPTLRTLGRKLAWSSSLLIDLVDDDCLYGSGGYGDALYEYLIAYQGLAHWVSEGDSSVWDYEALIEEADRDGLHAGL